MDNIQKQYKEILNTYEVASQHYINTGETNLLKMAIHELEQFERSFVEQYGLVKLQKMQNELYSEGSFIY